MVGAVDFQDDPLAMGQQEQEVHPDRVVRGCEPSFTLTARQSCHHSYP
jgi:hypothetical protein